MRIIQHPFAIGLHITDGKEMEALFYRKVNYDIMSAREETAPV